MATTQTESEQLQRLRNSRPYRAAALQHLATLVEQYPQLRIGQLLSNALDGIDPFYVEDDELARALDQLRITYHQFLAAGIPRGKL